MTSPADYQNSNQLRQMMVREQLMQRGISDSKILDVFMETPRHIFIPDVDLEEAYGDHPIPIRAGQTISQPFIVALMTLYLELAPSHDVLEVGSGSGYATAILSKLCKHIDAMEVYNELLQASSAALEKLAISNVTLYHNNIWEQKDAGKVYDRIILWASPPRVPSHLFDMLSEDGILVAPEGKLEQFVWIFKKRNGRIEKQRKDAVRFVPLVQGPVIE